MRPWVAPGRLARARRPLPAVPIDAGATRIFTPGRALRYAAPRGPERALWIARLRHPAPGSVTIAAALRKFQVPRLPDAAVVCAWNRASTCVIKGKQLNPPGGI